MDPGGLHHPLLDLLGFVFLGEICFHNEASSQVSRFGEAKKHFKGEVFFVLLYIRNNLNFFRHNKI